jgi:mannose/fructose/N-acetylgalactosamine-specific phosphotransferase system component IIB
MIMSVVLFRIDERLIHGQVVVGWGGQLHPDRIIVVDDAIADSEWEQDLYCLGMPPDVAAEFVTAAEARVRLDGWRSGSERVLVLSKDAATMLALGRGGLLRGAEINVGGLHHAPGRREVLPYVYLSGEEAAALSELAGEGADISARDLPNARRVPLAEMLRNGV